MKQEIERKYAIKYLPEDFKIERVINIKQCTNGKTKKNITTQ